MAGGGGLATVDVADDDDVEMSLSRHLAGSMRIRCLEIEV